MLFTFLDKKSFLCFKKDLCSVESKKKCSNRFLADRLRSGKMLTFVWSYLRDFRQMLHKYPQKSVQPYSSTPWSSFRSCGVTGLPDNFTLKKIALQKQPNFLLNGEVIWQASESPLSKELHVNAYDPNTTRHVTQNNDEVVDTRLTQSGICRTLKKVQTGCSRIPRTYLILFSVP